MSTERQLDDNDKTGAIFTINDSPSEQESRIREEDDELLDITRPFPGLPGQRDEPAQFTIRALIVGTVLGAVVSASNMYLCLKTGTPFISVYPSEIADLILQAGPLAQASLVLSCQFSRCHHISC